MALAPTAVKISEDSERSILTYALRGSELMQNQFSLRTSMELIDRYYMRECDWTSESVKARIANRLGDKRKLQDITVPIVMPQVEAALAYMANVFVTGHPVFGVSSDPTRQDAALQMETIIEENSVTAGWTRELIMFFRDGFKYNLHALECEWTQKTLPAIETDLTAPNGAAPKNIMWNGNVLKRMDLYNTFFDPRVAPASIYCDGEFAGYTELYSRVRMKQLINDLFGQVPVATVKRAFESAPPSETTSGFGTLSYHVPLINPYPLMLNEALTSSFDWMAWATAANAKNVGAINYQNAYAVTKLYARILPVDFGLTVPKENTPQVWKFLIVNGSVVLLAERCTNAHNYIPIFFGQPLEDGLNFQTKSFASNVMDMQDVASAMLNGFVASKRRLVGDRVLYDPLRVREKDINSNNPAAKIPVRPSAYGKPVGEAVYQFPFRDEATATLLQGSELAIRFANLINNQNPATQGQFVKGNKTLHEYQDVMGHGNSHNQLMALMCEAQVFTPLKDTIKLNILQYQEEAVIFNRDKEQEVNIKPQDLRKQAVHFKVSDGLMPVDKQMSTDEFQTALQVIGSSPALAGEYNIGPMTSYLFKLRGADLTPFEKPRVQIMWEQMMAQWQQVAFEAVKAGQQMPPMPQMPPELMQMLQSPNGVVQESAKSEALEETTGETD